MICGIPAYKKGASCYAGGAFSFTKKRKGGNDFSLSDLCDYGNDNGISAQDIAKEAAQTGSYPFGKPWNIVGRRGFYLIENKTFGVFKQVAVLLFKDESSGNHLRTMQDFSCFFRYNKNNGNQSFASENAAFFKNKMADISHAFSIYHDRFHGNRSFQADIVFREGNRLPVFYNFHMIVFNTTLFSKAGMES